MTVRKTWAPPLLALVALAMGILAPGCGKSAGDPTKVKIVSSLPRTGSSQGQTDTIVNGIKMAIDEYGGKVAGLNIEYVDMDDATASAGQWAAESEAANARKAAADPDVVALIGPFNSGAAKISMPILNDAGLVQISPACTWPGLTKEVPGDKSGEPGIYRPAGRVTFCRVCPTDFVQGPLSADFAKDELKAKKVYVLDDKELYGAGIAGLFAKRCKELGIEVLGHESIVATQQEFGALMTKIKALNPDLVYFGGTSQTKGGQIAKDMKSAGLNCPLMVPDGCYEKAFIDSAGAENVNGRCYATIGAPDPSQLTGVGAEFAKKHKEKYGKEPEAYAVYGYECAKAVLEAIKRAGKKDRAAVRDALLSTKDFGGGVVGAWSFDADGDTTLRQLTISKIENGQFKPVKTITQK